MRLIPHSPISQCGDLCKLYLYKGQVYYLLKGNEMYSIIVYYSDIRTFIHKGYNIIFNLYVQPNRAYKSL